MNNLDIFEQTFNNSAKKRTNCWGVCQAKISRLPFWINNQPFWTYQCKCCFTYKFEGGGNHA